jgi:hypothetical protein
MPGKDEFSAGALILVILIIIAAVASNSNTPTSQVQIPPQAETWRNYAIAPANDDVLAQIANTQKLIMALGDDLFLLHQENVNTKAALQTANVQLAQIQQQAAEDAKRQTRENWKFAIIGIIGGWLANFVFPTENLATVVIKILDKRKTKRKQQVIGDVLVNKDETSTANKEVKAKNISSATPQETVKESGSNVALSSARHCPKCNSTMKLGPGVQGEFKNSLVLVCPNCHEMVPFNR